MVIEMRNVSVVYIADPIRYLITLKITHEIEGPKTNFIDSFVSRPLRKTSNAHN